MTLPSWPLGQSLSVLSQKSRTKLLSIFHSARRRQLAAVLLLCVGAMQLHAAVVRGRVTDQLGAAVANAHVQLIQHGKVVATTTSGTDGRYELTSSAKGRFALLTVVPTFRQTVSDAFYAGQLGIVDRDIVLQPQGVTQQIVVTATGTPTPDAQVSSAISTLPTTDFATRMQVLDDLRLAPGMDVVQTGQRGGATSLFIRGGNSDANKVMMDGIPAEDVGGAFDFGNISTTGLQSVEVYRGPDSVVYGSDAAAGVVSFETTRGYTARPVLNYSGDAGNFGTYRNEVTVGGTRHKLDYFGAFSRFDTSNALKMDQYHDATSVANLGYSLTGSTQARFTVRNSVSATGLPGALDFTGISNDGKQSDQDLYLGGTLENQTVSGWHNLVRYAAARKREQSKQWYAAGIPIQVTQFGYPSTNYYGLPVTIRGANGYTATGQAVMNFGGSSYPLGYDQANNRDQLQYQSDYKFTQHLAGLLGFVYEDERGVFNYPSYAEHERLERRNYAYNLALNGDIRNRLFFSLAGALVKNHLFGVEATPRLGFAWYPVRPGHGGFHGTKLRFNFSRGVQEPNLASQFGSLNVLLNQQGDQADVQQYHIAPIGAELSRSYDGGVEQSILSQKMVARVGYFHNEFGRQIEFVDAGTLGTDFGIAPSIITVINNTYGGAYLNSLDFSAQGIETELEWRVMQGLFVRGGYTYLDAKVQRSFSGDNIFPSQNPNIPGVNIGASSPLVGGRPFRRPPHTGFAALEYTYRTLSAGLSGGFASRSDDSTFLSSYSSLAGDNSLLLPNRDLDFGYAKLDANLLYQFKPRIIVFTQLDNLLGEQHMGPIGYPALPFNFRAGLKLRLGGD